MPTLGPPLPPPGWTQEAAGWRGHTPQWVDADPAAALQAALLATGTILILQAQEEALACLIMLCCRGTETWPRWHTWREKWVRGSGHPSSVGELPCLPHWTAAQCAASHCPWEGHSDR